jgi:hypothetical protein
MLTPEILVSLIKSYTEIDGQDVHITIDELYELYKLIPDKKYEELISVLMEMQDVSFTDARLGGITIPNKYF